MESEEENCRRMTSKFLCKTIYKREFKDIQPYGLVSMEGRISFASPTLSPSPLLQRSNRIEGHSWENTETLFCNSFICQPMIMFICCMLDKRYHITHTFKFYGRKGVMADVLVGPGNSRNGRANWPAHY